MELQTLLLVITAAASLASLSVGLVGLLRKPSQTALQDAERRLTDELRASRRESAEMVAAAVQSAAKTQADTLRYISEQQSAQLRELRGQTGEAGAALQRSVTEQLVSLDKRLASFGMQNEQKLENIRRAMEEQIGGMQASNEKKLEEMRRTVDEKLQKTLEERLRQSFSLVSENLERVQRGLGEMQTLAAGVGDLKKVLGNVKTRGILGEIQLSAILEEILTPEQYAANVATVPNSANTVEFAVRLPGDGEGSTVWLPIDAKFPYDAYGNLLDAYENGESAAVAEAGKALEGRIRQFAKDIRDKYIEPPYTTDFGIMFLPVEGLYAEVVRRGLIERLQSEYRVNIAGPTTMAALLSSLQMGFRTLAIQKHSGEVWKVLGEVKTEFGKFSDYLQRTRQHLRQASQDIEHLLGTRTNMMQRKLRVVTAAETGVPAGTAVPEIGAPEEIEMPPETDIPAFLEGGDGEGYRTDVSEE